MSERNKLKEKCWDILNLEELKEKNEEREYYEPIKQFLELLKELFEKRLEKNESKSIENKLEIIEKNIACEVGKNRELKPDFLIMKDNKVIGVIEVKTMKSSEFNVKYSKDGKVILKSDGRLPCFLQYLRGDASYPNRANDGIGQVRGYYYALMYCKKLDDNAFAVLTNGEVWVVFKFRHERDNCKILDIAEEGIDKDKDKVWCFKLCDDVDKLIDLIINGQEPNTCDFEIEE